MYKIVFQLLLVTFLLNEATCFPHKHQQVISEKIPATRNPMRRFCTVKFRLIPKMISSFNTDFMMFKRPRIVCHWAKSQSEKKIPKNITKTTKSPRITTTPLPLTAKMPNLCTFNIEFASLFNFCNPYLRISKNHYNTTSYNKNAKIIYFSY